MDFGANLGSSWGVLGCLGRLLWCLGGVLKASSECLGDVMALGAVLASFWEHFGSILGPF